MSVPYQPRITCDAGDRLTAYCAAMEHLSSAIPTLSMAKTLPDLTAVVAATAREVMNADGSTFVLRDGDQCYYVDENAITPLWKGQRFPMTICIGGWTMNHACPVVIPDISGDERIPYQAYEPTFVKSLVMVPIRTRDPVGAIGVYWSSAHEALPNEVHLLQALADSTAVALANIQLYAELEARVQARIAALELEIEDRKRAEAEVRQLSLTDELTELNNRRGFYLLGEPALDMAWRNGAIAWLIFIDLDGLKQINDRWGHEAGDGAIAAVGHLLRETFRASDVVARLGGDEFVVLAISNTEAPQELHDRLQHQLQTYNQTHPHPFPLAFSIGIERCPAQEPLADVLGRADAKMYAAKREKKRRLR